MKIGVQIFCFLNTNCKSKIPWIVRYYDRMIGMVILLIQKNVIIDLSLLHETGRENNDQSWKMFLEIYMNKKKMC